MGLPTPIRRIGLLGHARYPVLQETFARVRGAAAARGIEVFLEEGLASFADGPSLSSLPLERQDLLVTLGGDGTLLRAARMAAPSGVPVFGINLGRLGFLTSAGHREGTEAFEAVLDGRGEIDERMLLDVRAVGATGDEHGEFHALNDAVLHKGGFARVIELAVHADGEEVGSYSADGIILSTPTGSTAYSLSAGGPIVSPSLDCIVATPICPHTLAVRPLVLPASETVTVEVLSPGEELILTIDGQEGAALREGDRVVVSRSSAVLRLVRLSGHTFFSTLRRKLRWGDLDERRR